MTVELAQAVLDVVGAYFALGAAFAVVFLSFGLRRLDPIAASGPLRFKLLIAPGIVALWPVMLSMWLFGGARRGNVKRSQRRFHANIWPVIAIVMLATLAVAVVVREHPAPPDSGGALMAHGYKMVQWNAFKKRYDAVLLLGIATYLSAFVAVTHFAFAPDQAMTLVQVLIRAFGSCAFGLLTLILVIGPLARLSPRFLPLLYNRRHLGVACFLLALVHAVLAIVWYQGFSDVNPFLALLISNPRYTSIDGFPFESLGVVALAILFVMAATSHDFWNTNLGPTFWKTLHMGVYVTYALLIAHIALGVIQSEKSPVYIAVLAAAVAGVAGLHMLTGARERKRDLAADSQADGWIKVGAARDMPDNRARIVVPPQGERIAVFRYGDKVSAVSNVCRHQGGPLGEGRIVDGCIVCPWHGFQYRPESGTSPPPYNEKVATYRTKIEGGIVYVHATAMAPGTTVAPSMIV